MNLLWVTGQEPQQFRVGKHQVRSGWTEIRTELKGTLGDDLGGILEDNWEVPACGKHYQLYSLHQGRKTGIPPTLHLPVC